MVHVTLNSMVVIRDLRWFGITRGCAVGRGVGTCGQQNAGGAQMWPQVAPAPPEPHPQGGLPALAGVLIAADATTVSAGAEAPAGVATLPGPASPLPLPLQVMLRVSDLEKSIKYYEDCIGMKLLRKRENPGAARLSPRRALRRDASPELPRWCAKPVWTDPRPASPWHSADAHA